MADKGSFDPGFKPTITVSCAGSLVVRGDDGSSIRFSGSNVRRSNDETSASLHSDGDLKMRVPHRAALVIEYCAGDVSIKGVHGVIAADGHIAGSVKIINTDHELTLHDVAGDVRLRHIGGAVTIKGNVMGELSARHCGGITVGDVHGSFDAKHIAGSVVGGNLHGDAGCSHVSGDVTLQQVAADLFLANIGGYLNVSSHDDIKVKGPLPGGQHTLRASSCITYYHPPHHPVSITARANQIVNRIQFETQHEKDGTLIGQIGDGGAELMLEASERITLRGGRASDGDFETFVDINLDMADFEHLGETISAEINARLGDIGTRLGPEINAQAERAFRRAQEAIDRAVSKMEREIERAERRAHRQRPPTPPPPPKGEAPLAPEDVPPPPLGDVPPPPKEPVPPPPPAKSGPKAQNTAAGQMKILKMLEEGTISVDEANELLAALG